MFSEGVNGPVGAPAERASKMRLGKRPLDIITRR